MKKKIISISLTASILLSLFFQCLFPVTVCALSIGGLQSTIASIIVSLMLECGAAPVNNVWLQTLNTSYGVTSSIGTIQDCINSGLLTQTASGLVDSGLSAAIESAPAYTELGLSEIFTTTADDVAMGVVAGSGGFNLATTAINVGTFGTIGAFAGAAAIGVGLGVLVNHLWNTWKNGVNYEMPLSEVLKINDSYVLEGGSYLSYVYRQYANQPPGFYSFPYGYRYAFSNNGNYLIWRNLNDISTNFYLRSPGAIEDNPVRTNNMNADSTSENSSGLARIWQNEMDPYFENPNDAKDYIRGLTKDDIKSDFMSPDIIGPDGNHSSTYSPDTGYVYDNQNPVVPDGYDFKPVDMEDYIDYADNANDNTENGDVNQPVQGEEFDNLIDSLLVEPSVVPDQGVTDPVVPDRPIIPEQPNVPDKEPITGAEQSEVLEGITTPDLRSVFPFCIPFDLYNIFGVLKYEGREAPVIVWEANIMGITYPVIIDLSPYEDVASILRLMELLLFIVGLAVATRSLIGAGG